MFTCFHRSDSDCILFAFSADESWGVEGSLGGLHLLDVTPEGTLYQQVVSIGQFQEADVIKLGVPTSPAPEMYQTAVDGKVFMESYTSACRDRKNACTFVLKNQYQKQKQVCYFL